MPRLTKKQAIEEGRPAYFDEQENRMKLNFETGECWTTLGCCDDITVVDNKDINQRYPKGYTFFDSDSGDEMACGGDYRSVHYSGCTDNAEVIIADYSGRPEIILNAYSGGSYVSEMELNKEQQEALDSFQ